MPFIRGQRPLPFNTGTSILYANVQHLDFMGSDLRPRFLHLRAWELGQRSIWVSKIVFVPKPGENTWRLIIDLSPLNNYCKERKLTYGTLKHVKNLTRTG
jgi:hypothetical protein